MTIIYMALFDMAATTVDDMVLKPGAEEPLPLVIAAYEDAFRTAGVVMPFDELNAARGRDKMEVFREKVTNYRGDLSASEVDELARHLHDNEFVPALLENVPYVSEVPGTTETFQWLKERGVYIATGSGFPLVVTNAINEHLGWQEKGLVDYGTCGESAGGGRPKANMINDVLINSGLFSADYISDRSEPHPDIVYGVVLKIGDTVKDVEEGLNVGATTIAVASGTQSVDALVEAGPKVVLPSVAALPQYLENHGYIFTRGNLWVPFTRDM